MIQIAKERYPHINFYHIEAKDIEFDNEFDLIFCNSAFQWFAPPYKILQNVFKALKSGGRFAILAPAKQIYSPNFIKAIEEVKKDLITKEVFSHFKNPWFFLENESEYKDLFEDFGFAVEYADIKKSVSFHTPKKIYDIFNSGAVAGYLNQKFYDISLSKRYIERFKQIVKDSFIKQANDDGLVELIFYRIYLIARKEI